MRARDPRDRTHPARLTLSTVLSLVLHVLLALLLFTVVSSSSQEGATGSIQGGEIVTVQQRAVAQAQPAPAPSVVPPVPHVPLVAPLHHAPAPQTAAQRQPQNHHELAQFKPKSAPNPLPVPQSTARPNPQPTVEVFEPKPDTGIPAAPLTIPEATVIAVAIKAPPTAAPSPHPTSVPSAKPVAVKPLPSAAPSKAPATPAPVATSAALKPATVVARTSPSPATPAPGPVASAPPAKVSGVPVPAPTAGAAQSVNHGTSPTPGPKGTAAPGPHRGGNQSNHPGPTRPVIVSVTPSPGPSGPSASALNSKLRSLLLPSGTAKAPTSAHIAPGYGSISSQLDPSPPPDVIAHTIYLYQSSSNGEKRVKMWVTSVHKEGPLTICSGWMLTYPKPPPLSIGQPNGGLNGTQISLFGGHAGGTSSRGEAGMAPIVEANVTFVCQARDLTPFTP